MNSETQAILNRLTQSIEKIRQSLIAKEVECGNTLKLLDIPNKIRELEIKKKEVFLIDGPSFNSILAKNNWNSDYIKIQGINFVYDNPPEGAALIDVSKNKDNSVVLYNNNNNLYVSGYGNEIIADENCSQMFLQDEGDGSYYTNWTYVNLENLNTINTINMSNMFEGLQKVTSITFGANFKSEKVTNMKRMFYNCSTIEELNLNNLDVGNVEDASYIFSRMRKLKTLINDKWNLESVKNISGMFENCNVLPSINTNIFRNSKPTTLYQTFSGCGALTDLDLSILDTSLVENMSSAFSYCSLLSNLNLDNFNTENVTNFNITFSNCSALKTLNLKHFKTEKVTNFSSMFNNCTSLTQLDLSIFSVKSVTSTAMSNGIYQMFFGCSKLNKIIAKDWVSENSKISSTTYVFQSCTALPNYSSSNTKGSFCKPISSGGYFTTP